MIVMISDAKFNSVALIIVALIALISAIATTILTRQTHKTAVEARDEAKAANVSAAEAAHEVKLNGGMSDPNPNLSDHVRYQTEMAEENTRQMQALLNIAIPLVAQVNDIDSRFTDHLGDVLPLKDKLEEVSELLHEHIDHSKVMDRALAEVYLEVKPDVTLDPDDN